MLTGPLPQGKTAVVIDETVTAAGLTVKEFGIDSDSVLISVFAENVTGDLDIVVKTVTDNNLGIKELPVITFPTITAATSNLIIRKAAAVMSRIRIEVTYTGTATYQVWARGVGTGEASVRILGASDGSSTQVDIGSVTPTLLVPSALADRSGIIIKNYNASGVLYLGYSSAEANSLTGYPIGPNEALAIDISASGAIYGIASTGTIDCRIMQASV